MARFWEAGSNHNGHSPDTREMLKFLGRSRPLELIDGLLDGRQDVSHLAESLDLDITNISPTLKMLHKYSLVEVKSIGSRHFYQLGPAVKASRADGSLVLEVRTSDQGMIIVTVPCDRLRNR